jgi:hypothetical protein
LLLKFLIQTEIKPDFPLPVKILPMSVLLKNEQSEKHYNNFPNPNKDGYVNFSKIFITIRKLAQRILLNWDICRV